MKLRIATWNVEHAAGVAKNARRLARMREAVAAIWVLTETHDSLALGADYHVLATEPRPHGREGERWVAIARAFRSRGPFPRAIRCARWPRSWRRRSARFSSTAP